MYAVLTQRHVHVGGIIISVGSLYIDYLVCLVLTVCCGSLFSDWKTGDSVLSSSI